MLCKNVEIVMVKGMRHLKSHVEIYNQQFVYFVRPISIIKALEEKKNPFLCRWLVAFYGLKISKYDQGLPRNDHKGICGRTEIPNT